VAVRGLDGDEINFKAQRGIFNKASLDRDSKRGFGEQMGGVPLCLVEPSD
jgi:hypothetical protein